MYKNLRIVFTILSAVCLAAAIPLGMFFDFVGLIGAALGAGIFFMLMLLCKQSQEFAEAKQKKASTAPERDGTDNETENTENADEGKDGNDGNDGKAKTPSSESAASTAKRTYKYKRNKK